MTPPRVLLIVVWLLMAACMAGVLIVAQMS
jgi:hypothetical protein